MPSSPFAVFLAQVTNAATSAVSGTDTAASATDAPAPPAQPSWIFLVYLLLFGSMIYFGFIRPQTQATKKKEDTIKTAKTGDKVVTSGGILGVITNVKESTVIVKIADNVKIEIEKGHIDKITRSDSSTDADKPTAAKA